MLQPGAVANKSLADRRHRPSSHLPGLALRRLEGPHRGDQPYRGVTAELPELQLALTRSMATDDPEGWEYFNSTMEYAHDDPDIKILNNLNSVGTIEVNAFQSQADVVIQKSKREGFGLTVTEALGKGRPVVAGNVGGIPLQVDDGGTGYLGSSPEDGAQRSLEILCEPELGKRLGRAGKEHVRRNFLSPRLVPDRLRLLGEVA